MLLLLHLGDAAAGFSVLDSGHLLFTACSNRSNKQNETHLCKLP